MSDLDLIRQLEDRIGKKLEAVAEEKFKVDSEDLLFYDFEYGNSYALSYGKELIGLYLLNVDSNKLSNFPFHKFKKITHLYLVDVELQSFSFLSKLIGLTSLNLRSNRLTDVSFLRELTKLNSLDLRSNRLTDVSFLRELKKLTSLDLGLNQLTNVSCLRELTELTSLDLSGNRLTDVSCLGGLTKLTSLNLGENYLTDVSFLSKLTELISLNLNCNNLTDVSFLREVTQLTSLDLRFNKLTDISFLRGLAGLTLLELNNNEIKEIPSWLTEKKLEIEIELEFDFGCINLHGNPIEKPPLEVAKQGNEAIRNYYTQIEVQGKEYLYEAKMLIVGEGESGKTTLAHKIENVDCPLPHIDDRTKGITINTHAFAAKNKNGAKDRNFQLNVWDFGGQEIYHATHRFFLSKRSLYVLVADNRKDDTDFNYWLNIIELFAGDSPMIIVLNEKGEVQRSINKSELLGRYPESIKQIVQVNFKTHEEKDSQKREQRLKQIRKLIRHIEDNAEDLPHIGEPVPARWIEVRQAIESDTRNYIYREQFDDICRTHNITQSPDITTLLSYVHDLGIVLHFADNPLLRNRVILKPAWATNAVYRIFDNDVIKAKEGRFTRRDCADLWSDAEYNSMHDVLIELMKNFRLVYEIGNTDNLVAPQMLPQNTPAYPWDANNNSRMQFRYDFFMPKGIFWQFVVTMYRYIENHAWVWRNGVVLKRGSTRAEVIENLFERRIYIRFSGPSIAEFRAIIADELNAISNTYHQLEYDKMIPCQCSGCIENPEPHFFRYSVLKKRQEARTKTTIECQITGEDVPLQALLEGLDIKQIKESIAEDIQETTPEVESKQEREIKTIKIFLASSSELKNDRREFEVFINRKNKEYIKNGLFLELVLWEDFLDAMSQTRLQDEYNKAVADCDVFVSLFHTKVGKYTEEEFLKALDTFKANGKPLIYTYFKDAAINMSQITPEVLSLLNFKQKLSDLGHFYTIYADINDLKHQFGEQLIKFLPEI